MPSFERAATGDGLEAGREAPTVLPVGRPARQGARIGPNALIQTGHALSALFGDDTARAVFADAGLARRYDEPPASMVDEAEPKRLFAAISNRLPAEHADSVLREAGDRTALYLLENRIPRPARLLLPHLPIALSTRILLKAISGHAWTFAGSGLFSGRVDGWRSPIVTLRIGRNPLATPGCPWHSAVFQRLFSTLTASDLRVSHPACCARGDDACQWRTTTAAPVPFPQRSRTAGGGRRDRGDRP